VRTFFLYSHLLDSRDLPRGKVTYRDDRSYQRFDIRGWVSRLFLFALVIVGVGIRISKKGDWYPIAADTSTAASPDAEFTFHSLPTASPELRTMLTTLAPQNSVPSIPTPVG
jgi:hypothetical protein